MFGDSTEQVMRQDAENSEFGREIIASFEKRKMSIIEEISSYQKWEEGI